ncbi:hypothetical protein RRG08_066039 [Elysia crispata]|uniref:Uncharacterized protein n=1 Tax=Elysia crispata TaxID=231223 RepID=A0AAE0Y362_9GAST|nr:hypothetical protein RRG08_066039 [Elysia crispata]
METLTFYIKKTIKAYGTTTNNGTYQNVDISFSVFRRERNTDSARQPTIMIQIAAISASRTTCAVIAS